MDPVEFPDLALIQKTSLKAVSPPNIFRSEVLGTLTEEPEEKKEISEYIVKEGDSIWSIAKNLGLAKETIISANNIKNNLVKPGQRLLILPLDGVIHLVKEGDTVTALAKKYKTEPEKIIGFNELSEDGDLFLDELLIIPGGKMPAEPNAAGVKLVSSSGKKHYYPWGWCTWWVEEKRTIPTSWGNAKNWLDRAITSGFNVCKGSNCAPESGAIISLKTSHPLGHVAYVEEVRGDTVIFSEMGYYYTLGEVNYRRVKIGDSRIIGYIY